MLAAIAEHRDPSMNGAEGAHHDRDGRSRRALDPDGSGGAPAAGRLTRRSPRRRNGAHATRTASASCSARARPTFGTHLFTMWPTIVEVVGHTGNFDYIEFSGEYAPYDLNQLEHWVRACELLRHVVDDQARPGAARLAVGAGDRRRVPERPVRRHPHARRGPGRGRRRPGRRTRATVASTASPTGGRRS